MEAFVPNPGRMHELMVPGAEVFVRHVAHAGRRTEYDLIAVMHGGVLVSIDSNLPNRFMKRMLTEHRLEQLTGYERVVPEPELFHGRADFRLEGKDGTVLIEVKSCTLVEEGVALFPDAPTTRGARHMRDLARALHGGLATRALAVFVIQRPDAALFRPNDATDPAFGSALREAHAHGVEILSLATRLNHWSLELVRQIPYDLKYTGG